MAYKGTVIAVEPHNGFGTAQFLRRSSPVIFMCNPGQLPSVGDRIRVDRLPNPGEILQLDKEEQ